MTFPLLARRLRPRTSAPGGRLTRSSCAGRRSLLALAIGLAIATLGTPSAGADTMAVGADWSWPAPPPIQVVEPFRAPPTPYAAGHRGVDLRAAQGDPVSAPGDGVVSFAGMVAGRPVVSIDHGDGLVSSLEPVVASATEGEPVARGAHVGVVGSGGHCDGDCVHLGARLHGEYVSPMLYLGGVPWAVLLPD